jgi:hypothetical protein
MIINGPKIAKNRLEKGPDGNRPGKFVANPSYGLFGSNRPQFHKVWEK